jgi:myo-inositol-1(or 4)-monophosphatase
VTHALSDVGRLLRVAETAARAGGVELLARFGKMDTTCISKKAHADYASEADLTAERAIATILADQAGGYGFLGEETGYRAGEEAEVWVVDPLDGTSNFIWTIPYFAVSIALCDAEGEVLGVVYDPLRDEIFTAIRGGGAWLNGTRLPALADKAPDDSMFSISLPVPGQLQVISEHQFLNGLKQVLAASAGIRRLGSAALDLAYVAAGRLDAYFEDGLSYYDLAAGKLVALEAGALVSKLDGEPAREGSVLAGRPGLHGWLRDTLMRQAS